MAETKGTTFNKWLYKTAYRFKRFARLYNMIPVKIRYKIGATLFRRAYRDESSTKDTSRTITNYPYGINVIGYLGAELGIGEGARAMLRACKAAGIPTAAIDFKKGISSRLREKIPDVFECAPKFGVTVLLVNPAQVPPAVAENEAALHGRYNIAFWNWELAELPTSWVDCTRFFNEIWAPSQFCANAFSLRVKIPVVQMPYAIDVPVPPGIGRRELGLTEDGFIFLFMFDALSLPERKNPMAIVKAYLRAKPSFHGKTNLILKMINGEKETDMKSQILAAIKAEPSIITIYRYFDRPEQNALFNAADCYVSLHRSEGFGLTLAEAMFLGKPVISTDWSSTTEFMTPWNSIPIPYRLVQIDRNFIHYPRGQWWADPDINAAADAMVHVANDPDFARTLGTQAARDIREKFSPEVVGKRIRARLDVVANCNS